jgi:glycosyltransferase involved in cell wall biosynthesis
MGRIVYFCFANQRPTGGNKIIYRHVEVLRSLGFDAYVLHPRAGFRYLDIGHSPPLLDPGSLRLHSDDLLVLPEDSGPRLFGSTRGQRRVIFNQNAYYTFRGFEGLEGPLPPYLDPEVVATLVVSEDNRRYITHAFPGVSCRRLHLSLNLDRFAPVPFHAKRRQICYMTRKNAQDVAQVLQILRSRGVLKGWGLQPIAGCTEAEVARIMGASQFFLTFGHPEGISLSNLEAMACGCRVIGYSGMGCREYFVDNLAREIPVGDVVAFARAVEEELAAAEADSSEIATRAAGGTAHVRRCFSPEAERADLAEAFRMLVGLPT